MSNLATAPFIILHDAATGFQTLVTQRGAVLMAGKADLADLVAAGVDDFGWRVSGTDEKTGMPVVSMTHSDLTWERYFILFDNIWRDCIARHGGPLPAGQLGTGSA